LPLGFLLWAGSTSQLKKTHPCMQASFPGPDIIHAFGSIHHRFKVRQTALW